MAQVYEYDIIRMAKRFDKYYKTFSKIYNDVFGETFTIEEFSNKDSLKLAYRKLSKRLHSDITGKENKEQQEINEIYENVHNWLQIPGFLSACQESKNIKEMSLEKYKRLKRKSLSVIEFYLKERWTSIESNYSDNDNLLSFCKTKNAVNKLYDELYESIDRDLTLTGIKTSLKTELEAYVDKNNNMSVNIYNNYLQKVSKMKNQEEIQKFSNSLKELLIKNNLISNAKKPLLDLASAYSDDVLDSLINEATFKMDSFSSKEPEKINGIRELYYNKMILRINYKNKIAAFLEEYKQKNLAQGTYSFTYPYIVEELKKISRLYDPTKENLNYLDKLLEDLREKIEEKKEEDLATVNKKKNIIQELFSEGVETNIFREEDRGIVNEFLNNIKTFGDFADSDNRLIKKLLKNKFISVYSQLCDSQQKITKDRQFDYQARKELILQAKSYIEKFISVCRPNNIYSTTQKSKIDYKRLVNYVLIIENIDYINNSIQSIKTKHNKINNQLIRDEYFNETETALNKRSK